MAGKGINFPPGAGRGTSGNDVLAGRGGDDLLSGQDGADVLYGFDGSDTLKGGNGADTLKGGRGSDLLSGGKGADVLNGGNGADILKGGRGDDTLSGGSGADEIKGGMGDDIFRFKLNSDSRAGKADTITGFEGAGSKGGDIIDISRLGDKFQWIGTDDFSGGTRDQARFEYRGSNTVIQINTGGDPDAEAQIRIAGGHDFTAQDFLF
jgi:Ca2+-binding RTX toxin-like protein